MEFTTVRYELQQEKKFTLYISLLCMAIFPRIFPQSHSDIARAIIYIINRMKIYNSITTVIS